MINNSRFKISIHFFAGRKKYTLPAIFLVSVAVISSALVSLGWFGRHAKVSGNAVGKTTDPSLIHKRELSFRAKDSLTAVGDRLEHPGKERLILTGSLSRDASSGGTVPIRIITEFPHKLRIEEERNGKTKVSGFDGRLAWVRGEALNGSDKDFIESLIFDSIDHYFLGQTQGFATRLLGTGFRPDDAEANYSGPLYDVYQVVDQIPDGDNLRQQPKFYYFNSQTKLLEQIKYERDRNGRGLKVEVRLGDWQQVDGQRIPTSFTRLENGEAVMQLTVTSTQISQRLADNSFSKQ